MFGSLRVNVNRYWGTSSGRCQESALRARPREEEPFEFTDLPRELTPTHVEVRTRRSFKNGPNEASSSTWVPGFGRLCSN